MAKAEVIQGFGATHQQAETAIPWAREALNRDPTSAELWGNLALLQYDAGDLGAAEQSALRSHAFFPYYVPALNTLGFIARSRGDTAEARQWFGRSLAVEPTQAVIRDLYTRGCVPKSKIGLIPPSERCP